MIKKIPDHYLINKDTPEENIPEATKYIFNDLKQKFEYSARISDLIMLLAHIYRRNFELFDPKTWNDARFLSHLMDLQIDFMQGQDIDLAELHRDLLQAFDWTSSEKKLFISDQTLIEERLWAIFLVISFPSHPEFNLYNNN